MDTPAPWFRGTYRWGQTNLTELDPRRYDLEWWREHWRRTRIQGVIVNAGGIVAYYPSHLAQHRADFLGDRDLFGEIVAAARDEGLAVLARMDCNRAHEPMFLEHPDWMARDAEGRPYREGELFITCINSPYYDEHIPSVIGEIVERSHPDGFTDNSWSGLDRGRICFCDYCARGFRKATGLALPETADWDSPAYRQWIMWSYARRLEIWDLFNRTSQTAGGPSCLYLGMNSGDIVTQATRFRDHKAICERSEIVMLDHQARRLGFGFADNADAGKIIHGLMGWDKLIPESTAHYQSGQPTFRLASKPEPEVRMWAVEGFAGGVQPWWHHIGAYHEDRRQYRVAEPIFRWHEQHQEYLVNRRPAATVGVVWSQRNVDFFGRDDARGRVSLPHAGVMQALMRARIPSIPVHADHVERDGGDLSVLILPNVGALSDQQCEQIRQFVARGGAVVATGETSRYDEWGDPRDDFGLADLFGCHATGTHHGSAGSADVSWERWAQHTYLRLTPELRAGVYGPLTGTEPPLGAERHPVLRGFDETDVLPFGGRLEVVRTAPSALAPITYIPPFPIYPPEMSWMRTPTTTLPALVLNEMGGGRVAYLPADVDRCFGRDYLPDHGDLLANVVRWAANGRLPVQVDGPGLLDCHLYEQPGRLILHVVNLSGAGTWRAPVHEIVPVGPVTVTLPLRDGVSGAQVRLLVSDHTVAAQVGNGHVRFEITQVQDHEVIVIS
ncbi:MAG: Tat pathway signal protein [Chloroflexi bacterium]|nr:Tat pathway signal protein [Chloroflexota bacterium]